MEEEILQGQKPSTRALSDPERDGLDYPLYQESSRPPAAVAMNPDDGLPQQIPGVALKDSLAPRLSKERFVCMADTSEFVQRDRLGNIVSRYSPELVQRMPNGVYVLKDDGFRVDRGSSIDKIIVEPLRPQCRHYVRQLMPWPDDPDRRSCRRYCAAMRNEQGELISLSDQELLACEMRDPRDFAADAQIDEFDSMVIAQGERALEEQTEFDINAELAKDNLGVLGGSK